jgi:hypothetical protein
MAVMPESQRHGTYSRYRWVLTSADQEAMSVAVADRNEKTVQVRGASTAAGFNGATLEIQGSLDAVEPAVYDLLNTVPDTLDLTFTAQSRIYTILPNVLRVKPVVSAGTVGSTGVEVVLLVMSANSRAS